MTTSAVLRVVVAVDPYVLRSAFCAVLERQPGLEVVLCPLGEDPTGVAAGSDAQVVLSSAGDEPDPDLVVLLLVPLPRRELEPVGAAVASMCERLVEDLPSVRFLGPT